MYTVKKTHRAMPKLIALVLVLILAFGTLAPAAYAIMPTRGDLIHYIPVAITVDTDSVMVYGFFTNLNPDCSVSNFRDFGLAVVMDGNLVASGVFGTLNSFTIGPEECIYYTFVFPGKSGLYPGAYICDDDDYGIVSCTFDYSELVYKSSGVK